METSITLTAKKRPGRGKGPARRLRAQGALPAIVYGPGHEAITVAVDPRQVRKILTAPLGRNTVVTLDIEGTRQLAMLKSFEYHPLTRDLEHADFYTVQLERPIVIEVPFATTGKAKGVAAGGLLRQVFRKLPVKCTPDKIPAKLEIDVSDLELGAAFHVRDLKLPEGVSVMLDPGQTIVSVVAPEKEEKGAAVTGGEATAPAAAAGAAKGAAPAGAAKAPAAGAAKAPAAGAAKAPAAGAAKGTAKK
jgi:large subunit ribosomal protein L25